MKRTLKFIFAALILLLVLMGCLWLVTDGPEDWQRERAVRSLVASGALQQQVSDRLQLHFIDSSIGSPNRAAFEQWLAREPATSFVGIRDSAAKYPGVWHHSTMWTMTWLFFDADGRLREYYTCAQ